MRVLVMGAGAVGGYFGAALARAGHGVTFVARGAHLAAMRERGLAIRTGAETTVLRPVSAAATPAEAGGVFDLVLFTVKGYDTDEAAVGLRPVVGPGTAVLTLQNGIDSVERLVAALGAEPVLAGTAGIEATIAAPGVIEQQGVVPRIVLGEPAGPVTPRVEAVAAALRGAGIDVTVTSDAPRAVWEKFVRLAPGASLTTACDATIGGVRGTPEGLALYRALIGEGVAVGRAAGVALPASAEAAALAFIEALPASMKTSMQRDYERRGRVELESLAGAVVRLGRKLGVPTPTFDVVYGILKIRALGFGALAQSEGAHLIGRASPWQGPPSEASSRPQVAAAEPPLAAEHS
jgi:2-dehydropantoate 2-reductase